MNRKLISALFSAGLVAVSASTYAQVPTTPNPDPTAVQAGTYAIEPAHTRVLFGISHLGISTYYGEFNGTSGTLNLDPKAPSASRIEVSVPVGSIYTPSDKLNNELKSADWLDAGKYPTMTFYSTKVTPTGPRTADVTGNLTLHGVTKPVVLKATFNAAGPIPMAKSYAAGFEVSGQIKRSDFGVKAYLPLIGDDVDLTISAAFEHK
ncbi:MAG: Polyisoprenoid-binding protein [Rhodospirillales bacterium]|nr:Polyisoprenoid-binding protein [Rhodospirillales bacterium]